MRNSSLVEWFCAENVTGLKCTPKLGLQFTEQRIVKEDGALFSKLRGRGASYTRRSMNESACGLYTSENAGMSSANYVRIIMAESLRF